MIEGLGFEKTISVSIEMKLFLPEFTGFWNQYILNNYRSYIADKGNWWMKFKYDFKMFYIRYCRRKLTLSRRHDQILENGLYYAVQDINKNPDDKGLFDNYKRIKTQLVESKIKKREGVQKSSPIYHDG